MYKIYSLRSFYCITEVATEKEAKEVIYELEMFDHNNGEFFPNTYKYIKVN